MKTYFFFLCLIISSGLASASIQTAVSQDKPPHVYFKSYSENVGSITTRKDNIFNPNFPGYSFQLVSATESFSYNVHCNWSDGSGGSYSRISHDVATTVCVGDYYNLNLTIDWNINTLLGTIFPFGTETDINTIIELDNVHRHGNGTAITTNTYYNAGVPYAIPNEHCDMTAQMVQNYITSYEGDDAVLNVTTTRHAGQTVLKLRTGGKAISKLRNLIGINASATQVYPPSDNSEVPPLSFDDQVGPLYFSAGWLTSWHAATNIPYKYIAIGSYGSLNASGILYKTLPDNVDVDVTPFVAGVDDYTFSVSPQKYHSYFDLFVQQANPGYSLIFYNPTNDVGHAFWRFRTDAPADALQYISSSLTGFLGQKWGFYPLNGLFTVPGILQNDNSHSFNIQRSFYVGFPDLLQGLIYTRGISNAPPVYSLSGFNCVGAARGAGFTSDIFGLPGDESPQNFGVTLIEMYPAPGQTIGPFIDTNDVFYSSAPY